MLFARFIGRLDWACPNCNAVSKTRIKLGDRYLECPVCRRKFFHGVVFYETPTGHTQIPRDTLMIEDGFTIRRLVNRVYCDQCGTEVSNKTLVMNKTHEVDHTNDHWWKKEKHRKYDENPAKG